MGRTNSHLHCFTFDGARYGMQVEDYSDEELDETEHTVFVALRRNLRRLVYEYDSGDSWTHDVVVEDVTRSHSVLKHGVCLDGRGHVRPKTSGA
jgi:Plasmid pRiA4b ORF-3-like protein